MMMIGEISLILGVIGLIAAYYFYRKSSVANEELIRAINALWEATTGTNTSDQLVNNWIDVNIRLQADEYKSGQRRGRIRKKQDGTFSIDWAIEVSESMTLSAQVSAEVKTKDEQEIDSEEIYVIPVFPHAIECPHCGNVQPPTSSTCSACEREFDWDEAYHLYLLNRDQDESSRGPDAH